MNIVVVATLGLIGIWLANSYRRRVRFDTTELLMANYTKLWEITGKFGLPRSGTPITDEDRLGLRDEMDSWRCGANLRQQPSMPASPVANSPSCVLNSKQIFLSIEPLNI